MAWRNCLAAAKLVLGADARRVRHEEVSWCSQCVVGIGNVRRRWTGRTCLLVHALW